MFEFVDAVRYAFRFGSIEITRVHMNEMVRINCVILAQIV